MKAFAKDERQTFLDKHACRYVHNSVHVKTQYNMTFLQHVSNEGKILSYYEVARLLVIIVLVKNADKLLSFFKKKLKKL